MKQKNQEIIEKELLADEEEATKRPLKRKSTKKYNFSEVPEGELLGKGMRRHKKKNSFEGRFAIQAEIYEKLEELCDFQQQTADILGLVIL